MAFKIVRILTHKKILFSSCFLPFRFACYLQGTAYNVSGVSASLFRQCITVRIYKRSTLIGAIPLCFAII
jgi:hypothetical protein